MARSIYVVPYTCTPEEALRRTEVILNARGYHPHIQPSGEPVWKKGTGLMTAMHFIKVEYAPNAMQVSGWVQAGIGNAGLNEMNLDGVVACIPKKAVKKVIEEIQRAFY